jgi:hypothetical protein
MTPLFQLKAQHSATRKWWEINNDAYMESNAQWEIGVQQWYQQDYLNAMQGFQQALEPYWRAWDANLQPQNSNNQQDGLTIAKRLLFCAYCEMDGQKTESARQRLVQCLSISLRLASSAPSELLNDAWMELMLSMEEEPITRPLAAHVASLTISSGHSCCGWQDPFQRPGFMAPLPKDASFTTKEEHPSWCKVLEDNSHSILEEYEKLKDSPHYWTRVGSGERGSGQDDHRVVSGQNWTEYVLFGTGSHFQNDAPFTKQLLRQHVPDAVSLAEMGGGEVIFSRLAPHTRIGAHCGPTNLRKTAHLGLVVPTTGRCQIRVGSGWYSWEPGKILLFDDSYEHEVRNDTDEDRVVLLIRTWHSAVAEKDRERFLLLARSAKDQAVDKRYHPPS